MAELTGNRRPARLPEFSPSTLPAPGAYQDMQIILIQPDGTRQILFSDGRNWAAPGGATAFMTLSDAVSAPIATTNASVANALGSKATQVALDAHTTNTNNPHGVTKAQVGLSNADNTSDLAKPISTATQAAINAIVAGAGSADMALGATQTVTGPKTFASTALKLAGATSGAMTLAAAAVAGTGTWTLPAAPGGADQLVGRNTQDTLTLKTLTAPTIATILNGGALTLPTGTDTLVGRATADALSNKTLVSASLTGNSTAITQAQGDNSTLIATTAHVFAGLTLKANAANAAFTGTTTGITAAMVGLGSVNNTSDAAKPISSATALALAFKAPSDSPTFTGTVGGITKAMVGLANVDNTSDANKPISTATAAALAGKQGTLTAGANISISVGNVISASGGGGSTAPVAISYATAIPFTQYAVMPEQTQAGAIAFTINTGGAVDDAQTKLTIVANGVNIPSFAVGFTRVGEQDWVNVAGQVINLDFWREAGRYYYSIYLGPVSDAIAPTITAISVTNAFPSRIYLTHSEPIAGTISPDTAFAVSAGHALTAHTYVDQYTTYLTTSTAFTIGETTRTLAHSQPGSDPRTKDLSGNPLGSFSGATISNTMVGAGTSKVRLPSLNATYVTESGDGTAGWNYVGVAGIANIQDDAHGCASTVTLGASANGYIEATLGIGGDNGNTNKGTFGLDTDAALTERGTLYGIYYTHDGTNNSYRANTPAQYSNSALNGTDPGIPANGDKWRVKRTGSTITVECFKSGGSAFVVAHTYTGAPTGVMYAKAHVSDVCAFNNLVTDAMA